MVLGWRKQCKSGREGLDFTRGVSRSNVGRPVSQKISAISSSITVCALLIIPHLWCSAKFLKGQPFSRLVGRDISR